MYIDTRGKTGFRSLLGTSGKTYGNLKLLTPAELAEALADGIEVQPPSPPEPPSPEMVERRRKAVIRENAWSRINRDLLGTLEEGDNTLVLMLLKILQANRGMAVSLIQKGLMTPADFQPAVKDLSDQTALYMDIRQAAVDAIQNGDTAEEFLAVIDAIIPPTTEV